MGLYMSTFENMPAYKRMMADFVTKGYTTGEGRHTLQTRFTYHGSARATKI